MTGLGAGGAHLKQSGQLCSSGQTGDLPGHGPVLRLQLGTLIRTAELLRQTGPQHRRGGASVMSCMLGDPGFVYILDLSRIHSKAVAMATGRLFNNTPLCPSLKESSSPNKSRAVHTNNTPTSKNLHPSWCGQEASPHGSFRDGDGGAHVHGGAAEKTATSASSSASSSSHVQQKD